jgi:hypothetical protein
MKPAFGGIFYFRLFTINSNSLNIVLEAKFLIYKDCLPSLLHLILSQENQLKI